MIEEIFLPPLRISEILMDSFRFTSQFLYFTNEISASGKVRNIHNFCRGLKK